MAEDERVEKTTKKKLKDANTKLKKLEKKYSALLEKKTKTISDFEKMMGPALREGSWQAENYKDYGTKYNGQVSVDNSLKTEHIGFIWDTEPFEEEQLPYRELFGENGSATTIEYFPCLEINNSLEKIKDHLTDLSFIIQNKEKEIIFQKTIGSGMFFSFLKNEASNSSEILPVILLIPQEGEDFSQIELEKGFLGTITTKAEDGVVTVINKLVEKINFINLNETNSQNKIVYPRLEVNSLLLKVSEDELIIKSKIFSTERTLKNYYDYSILSKEDKYYITLNSEVLLEQGNFINKIFDMSYALSNAALSVYLDALEVSKTNAFPQVSYTLNISALNKDFLNNAYLYLNRIVNINDDELKFEKVQGYISELELVLDKPWEDSVIIQNYKTKFEDLFSTIVASTEQMKTNSFSYNNAVSAFGPGGSLKQSVLQNAINQVDLTYAFQNGTLTIDEINGIWGQSEDGVVAYKGGGIFCATEKDSLGNWIWNTGLTPRGISASLITAGQLDTNLIKVYAGDNLRLQLNSEGLFAYKQNEIGDADLTRFVVHNSEGLFSRVVKSDTIGDYVDLVEVSWDGFKLRNINNTEVFSADLNGNLSITGTITANDGYIGAWKINDKGLITVDSQKNPDGRAGILATGILIDESGNNLLKGHEKMLWVTGTKNHDGTTNEFIVTTDGTVYCSDAIIRGTLSADTIIGNTFVEEVNKTLHNISLQVIDGTTFTYDNSNYDNNYKKYPEELKFRISTNSLDLKELTPYDLKDVPENEMSSGKKSQAKYSFWYGNSPEESEWIKLETDEDGNNENLIWNFNYLTFSLKNDIMITEEEGSLLIHPELYFKIKKEGSLKEIDPVSKEISYLYPEEKSYIYSSEPIQLVVEKRGFGKYITPLDPPSYSFIEDKNKELEEGTKEKETTTFSVTLTGFTKEEIRKRGYWLIDGGREKFSYPEINGENSLEIISQPNSAALVSDSNNLQLNEEIQILAGDQINGNLNEDRQEGVFISLVEGEKEGEFIASITISADKIEIGGNIAISFHIDSAVREGFCFRTRAGSDSIIISLESSSGSILESGDIETELSVLVYYGRQVMNENPSKQYYYVWKKKEKDKDKEEEKEEALSNFKVLNYIKTEDENLIESQVREDLNFEATTKNGIANEVFFKQKKILISAADFGSKANYYCYVFTDKESALEEYLLGNENGDTNLKFE